MLDLGLAVTGERARLESCLQLPGPLEELRLRGDLAYKHLPWGELGSRLLRGLGVLERHQFPSKLGVEKEQMYQWFFNKNYSRTIELIHALQYPSHSRETPILGGSHLPIFINAHFFHISTVL